MKSLIIIGPSGVGKGTIIKSLLAKYPIIKFVLSFTTRLPRNYEINGVDYEFVSEEQFDQIKNAGEMLENKTVFQKSYGTSLKSYSKLLEGGYIPIMDVDVEGMLDIRSKLIQLGHHPEVLCILPPSLAILYYRLNKRGSYDTTTIDKRMRYNIQQIYRMHSLKNLGLHYTINYQYQLTVYGIQLFLQRKFNIDIT